MSNDTKKRHTNLTMIHLFESHLFNLSSVKQQRVVFLCLFDSSSCWSCWFFSISMMFHLGLVPLFILAWHLNSQLLAELNLCDNYVSTVNPKLSYKSPEVRYLSSLVTCTTCTFWLTQSCNALVIYIKKIKKFM